MLKYNKRLAEYSSLELVGTKTQKHGSTEKCQKQSANSVTSALGKLNRVVQFTSLGR